MNIWSVRRLRCTTRTCEQPLCHIFEPGPFVSLLEFACTIQLLIHHVSPVQHVSLVTVLVIIHISDHPFALPYPCDPIQGGVRHLARMDCAGSSAAPPPRTVIGPPMVSDGIQQSREHSGGPVGAADIPVHQRSHRWYHPHVANATTTDVFSRRRLRDVAAAPVHAAYATPHESDASERFSCPATSTATCPSSIPSSLSTSSS